MLDVHVEQTDVPSGKPGDDPRRNLPLSPMSPGHGGMSLSLLVPVIGKSSRRSGIMGFGQSPAMSFPRTDATSGEWCVIGIDSTAVTSVPRTSSTPGEIGTVELRCRTVLGFSQIDSA